MRRELHESHKNDPGELIAECLHDMLNPFSYKADIMWDPSDNLLVGLLE